MTFYNYERHHQGLNYKKPAEIYFETEFSVDPMQNVDKQLLIAQQMKHIVQMRPQVQQP